MKKLYKAITAVTALFLLVGCGSSRRDTEPPTPDIAPTEDPESIFDDLGLVEDELAIEDKSYFYSDHEEDVDKNYKVKFEANPEAPLFATNNLGVTMSSSPTNFFSISDNEGNELPAQIAVKHDEDDKEYYEASLTSGTFREGGVYIASRKNDTVMFKDKDPEMDTLYFNIERENALVYNVSDEVKYFDISKVTQFSEDEECDVTDPNSEEAKEFFENQTYTIHYSDNSFGKLKEGDNFAITPYKQGKPELDFYSSFYGKFVSNKKINDHDYEVTYKNVDLYEIFKDNQGNTAFDIYQSGEPGAFNNVDLLFNKENILKQFREAPNTERLVSAMLLATGHDELSKTTVYDILHSISLDLKFAYNAPKFTFQLKFGIITPFQVSENTKIKAEFTWQYTSTMSCSASVELKKFLGIPYWIEAQGQMTQTKDIRANIKIIWMRTFTPDEEKDTSDMSKLVRDAYQKLERNPGYFVGTAAEAEAKYSNNQMVAPIASFDFPFGGIFAFHIGLDFVLTLDFNVFLEYQYSSHSVETLLSFSSDDGVRNTANTQEMKSSCHGIDLAGKLGIELGARFDVGLCVVGLSKIFSLGFLFEGGLYLSITAMGGITWGSEQTPKFYGGIDFDFGTYGRISAYLNILVFHPKYEFIGGRKSFLAYAKPFAILDLLTPAELSLTDTVTSVSQETQLTTGKIFNSETFEIAMKSFKLNEEATIKTGDNKYKIKPISMTSDSPNLVVDADHDCLIVPEEAPAEFTCTLTTSVHPDVKYFFGQAIVKTTTIHFRSRYAHDVVFENAGVNNALAKDGHYIQLPNINTQVGLDDRYTVNVNYQDNNVIYSDFKYDPDYYEFQYFTDGKNRYEPGDKINVTSSTDKKITIKPVFKLVIYYTATFYNGLGQVISRSRVKEFTSAVAPSMDQIMQGMNGYTFYGWDRDFSYMVEDINVYGIYYKYSQGGNA